MSARVVRNGEGVEWNVMGDVVRVILSQDETGGGMSLAQQSVKPGSGIPLHVNTREDEVFQVLEGELEFQIGDGTVVAEPGTTIYAPRHTPHGFRAAGSTPALLQITMIPGGLEKMVEEISRLPMPPNAAEVGAICERYGVKFLTHLPVDP